MKHTTGKILRNRLSQNTSGSTTGSYRWPLVLIVWLLMAALFAGCNVSAQPTPTSILVETASPTSPTINPTNSPVPQETPTEAPIELPMAGPTTSPAPTVKPTITPTRTPTMAAAMPTSTATIESAINSLSVANIFGHVTTLASEIGSRPAGSANTSQAREYIARTLRAYGYEVNQQTFSFPHFSEQGSSVTMIAPVQKVLSAHAMVSSNTKEVSGEIVSVGLGRSSDYAGKDVVGKIALVKRGELTFSQKTAAAKAAGVAGLVIFNNGPGCYFGWVSVAPSFPVLAVSGEDGDQLLNLANQGKVSIKLTAKTTADEGQDANVMTRVPPNGPWMVIGAHLDSVPTGPGANDNASGIGLMLEMARLVAQTPYKDQVAFVAFTAEENGFLGSNTYVGSLSQDRRNALEAMINLDMVGEGANLYVRTNSNGPLANNIITKANRIGIKTESQTLIPDSDFAPFSAAGMRVFDICTDLDTYYHTNADTIDKISKTTLSNAAQVAWLLFEGLTAELGQ